MQDIAPDLLKKILEMFAEKTEQDPTIAAILERIDAGTATAEDVQRFAIALGGHESDALLDVLTPDVLPDGKMYYNIAERTVRPTIEQSHELFSEAAAQIQKQLNENAGIGLRAVTPKLDEDRVRGIIDKISDAPLFEDVRWMLNEPIRVLVQSFADEFVKANAEFQADAGLSPTITRTVVGGCCQWCRALAGKYTYPNDVPDDVYRRHAYCRCLVTYDPGDGSKRVQNVHSKKWQDYAGKADEDLPEVKIEQRRGVTRVNNSDLPNGLPIRGTPDSVVDKIGDMGEVLQRREYDSQGRAMKDFDTSNHGQPKAHPTGAHKHEFNYNRRRPRSLPLKLTEEELEENADIIRRGDNYHDEG